MVMFFFVTVRNDVLELNTLLHCWDLLNVHQIYLRPNPTSGGQFFFLQKPDFPTSDSCNSTAKGLLVHWRWGGGIGAGHRWIMGLKMNSIIDQIHLSCNISRHIGQEGVKVWPGVLWAGISIKLVHIEYRGTIILESKHSSFRGPT